MADDDVIYLDGIKRTLEDLGVKSKSQVNSRKPGGKLIPFMVNEEMRSLYKRAIEDNQSLTAEERNRVLGRVPLEVEEQLCQRRLGCSRQHLYDKASSRLDDLTSEECDMIVHGFDYDWRKTHQQAFSIERKAHLDAEDRNLVLLARRELRDTISDKVSVKAKEYREARSARARKKRDMIKAARAATKPKWLEEVADELNQQRWGFVVIRTADNDIFTTEAWVELRGYYDRECEQVLQLWNRRQLAELNLWNTHESVFIWEPALEGASTDTLRAWFKAQRDDLPDWVRRDCFLVADDATLPNERVRDILKAHWPSYEERCSIRLRAVDADFDASKAPATVDYGYESTREPITETDLEGFAGEVRTPVLKIFDWLYYTLDKNKETWEDRYKQTTQLQPKHVFPWWPYPEY